MVERRRRVRCRLSCELLGSGKTRTRSSIVTLSEGGFAVETEPGFEMGDELRLCILPHRRERAIKVTGIVWNENPSRRRGSPQLVFGCVVSDPPPRFLSLMTEVEAREAPRSREAPRTLQRRAAERRPAEPPRAPAPPPPSAPAAPPPSAQLPRYREPVAPPKPEPEENLPRFRVRLKQVGGSRSRSLEVRAHSASAARERAEQELAADDTAWHVLEVQAIDTPRRRPGA